MWPNLVLTDQRANEGSDAYGSHGQAKSQHWKNSNSSGILKAKPNDIEAKFAPYAEAAVQEYVRMFLGQKVFTVARHEGYRLFLLIRIRANGSLPDEQNGLRSIPMHLSEPSASSCSNVEVSV